MKMVEIEGNKERELARLAALPDDEIDMSDIPEASNWSNAVIGKFFRPEKKDILLPIDADVLDWFETHSEGGADYKTAMNDALRSYVVNKQSVQRG